MTTSGRIPIVGRAPIVGRVQRAGRIVLAGRAWDPVLRHGRYLWYDFNPIASKVTLTGSLVDQWNDSGTGLRHLTSSGALRPTWVASARGFNDNPYVNFPASPTYMETANWTSLAQPCTFHTVCRQTTDTRNQNNWLHDGKAATQAACYREAATGNWRINSGTDLTSLSNAAATFGLAASLTNLLFRSSDVHIITEVHNGASSKVYEDGVLKVTGNAGTGATTGLRLGCRFSGTNTNSWTGDMARHIRINKALTAAEVAYDVADLAAQYIPGRVIWDGDSLTKGTPYASVGYPEQCVPLLNQNVGSFNVAVGSQRASDLNTHGATVVDTLCRPTLPFVKVVWLAGVNDMFGVAPPAPVAPSVVKSRLDTYATARAAMGANVQVYALTSPVYSYDDALRRELNALILANASGAPYRAINAADIPELQDSANPAHFVDALHWTDAAALLVAQRVARDLNRP